MTAVWSANQKQKMSTAQHGICTWCDLPLPDDLAEAEVDHIIPVSRGGPNLPWNRCLMHLRCNRRKKDRLTDEAMALAAQYGITLIDPPAPVRNPGRLFDGILSGEPLLFGGESEAVREHYRRLVEMATAHYARHPT